MNVIEAKIYLLLKPGVNRVTDCQGYQWLAEPVTGNFNCLGNSGKMAHYAPFTKVEPERSNLQIAEEIVEEYESTESRFREILNAVDDKIRRGRL